MSAWKEYKAKLGETRPWDLVKPSVEWAPKEQAQSRYLICSECPRLLTATNQCKECGCFMKLKTQLANARCPIGKW
jgi:hypothetical protein